MRTRIKLGICGLLLLTAIFLAAETISSFDAVAATPEKRQYSALNYVLGEFEGKIAVYKDASGVPQTVTDIELSSLRETDRLSIMEGIEVESVDELLSLLEDFGS